MKPQGPAQTDVQRGSNLVACLSRQSSNWATGVLLCHKDDRQALEFDRQNLDQGTWPICHVQAGALNAGSSPEVDDLAIDECRTV